MDLLKRRILAFYSCRQRSLCRIQRSVRKTVWEELILYILPFDLPDTLSTTDELTSNWALTLTTEFGLRISPRSIELIIRVVCLSRDTFVYFTLIPITLACLRAILYTQQHNVGTVHTSFITLHICRQGQRNKHSSQLHYHCISRRTHLWRKSSITMVGRCYFAHCGKRDN